MAEIPTTTDLDITAGNTSAAVRDVLEAKYADANNWATWSAGMLKENIADINNLLGTDIVGNNLASLTGVLDAIQLYTPPGAFTYTPPAAPLYDVVPTYAEQTLGAILAIPAVETISIGDAPSTAVTFENSEYSDSLLGSLKTKLSADLAAGSTGLGDAEAALFARSVARENDVLDDAYNQITADFSSRGYDMPPGGILALKERENNKSVIRLTDVNAAIMSESAKLAQSWNQTTVTACAQIQDILARVFDSRIVRSFEAEKIRVTLALEGFKQEVAVALAKADLNKVAIAATVAVNDGTIKAFVAEIEGQTAPIKAIAEGNQAQAQAYSAAVQASVASLNAQAIPEELKLKGVTANAQVAGVKSEAAANVAKIAIDAAVRQLTLEVTTIQGLAQSASTMVAAALNGVSVATSFGYKADTSVSVGSANNTNTAYTATPGTLPTLHA